MRGATTTDPLAEVLRDLSILARGRFQPIPAKGKVCLLLGGDRKYVTLSSLTPAEMSYVLSACMEECGYRGWIWEVGHDPNVGSSASVLPRSGKRFLEWNYPALALATALRDALKAEEGMPVHG